MFRSVSLAFILASMMLGQARADFVYSVTGRFGADYTGFPATGLAFGSFEGTFTTATTLNSTDFVEFSFFNVSMKSASGAVIATITSSHLGDTGSYDPTDITSGRDFIQFYNGSYGLQLDLPISSRGVGPIIPTDTYIFSTYGSTPNSFVTITSGLVSVPEPASLTLCGVSVVIGLGVARRRRA